MTGERAGLKKAFLIAQWEFRAAVFRRGYVIAVVLMPLLFFGLGLISVLATSSPASRAAAGRPIGIVDKAGIMDVAFASEQAALRERLRIPNGLTAPAANLVGSPKLTAYADQPQALTDLAAEKLSAVYVIEPDYVATGNITTYSRDASFLGQAIAGQRANAVGDAIRASLMRKGLTDNEQARAYAPVLKVTRKAMNRAGEIADVGDTAGFGTFAGSLGVFILFTMSIFFSAGFLQQATVEDRQNRVFEVLLSSVDPDSLILGKIAGLGAAGLLQVSFYVLVIVGTGSAIIPSLNLSLGRMALTIVYFAIGYLMFASLMAAVGMMARTAQESAQLSAIWTLGAMAPMFFLFAIVNAPNGLLARALSFFPLSSPTTMLLRLTISTEIPLADVLISIAIGAVSVYLALRGTVRIFRAATLMYGKRPTLPELMRWLKAA